MSDEWKETWDWAVELWGGERDASFRRFFNAVAQKIAEAEAWEELGSSDVWHASYSDVKRLKESGEVTTREELVTEVLAASGYFYGVEESMMITTFAVPGNYEGFTALFA